ncbi:neuropeptides capa receptor-like [Amphiura filiformis]|uniref:neuropeptides capa receptor-like n=1 Tax=Amphiura filiformis TaxID=82378 RepID=UPI003B21BD77
MAMIWNLTEFTGFCSQPDIQIRDLTDPELATRWLYSTADKFIIKVVVPVVSFLGIFGNGTFLYMCIRVKALRSAPITAYLFSLAICDIAFLVSANVGYTLAIRSRISAKWPMNSSLECSVFSIFTHGWYFVSLGLITLISVERYFAVCHPLKRINVSGRGRITKLVTAVWVLGFGLCLILVPQYANFTYYCVIWPDTADFQDLPNMINDCEPVGNVAVIWGSLLSIVSMVLTMIVNIVMYVRIIVALHNRPSSSVTPKADIIRYQITRTLIANGIIFFICQLPYRLWTLDDLVDRVFENKDILQSLEHETLVITVGRACTLLNSIINPYLYVFSCEHYRCALVEAFCGNRRSSVPSQERRVQNVSKSIQMSGSTGISTTEPEKVNVV